jgi:hypothetical protein
MTVDEIERQELLEMKDSRGKKDRKRLKKEIKEKEAYSRENFKKMKEEIDDLCRKVEEQANSKSPDRNDAYALGFNKEKYLNMGFIESAKWVRTFLARKMNEKMTEKEFEPRFKCLTISKATSKYIGMRTCARFNRGEECMRGRWHPTHLEPTPWHANRQQEDGDRQQPGLRKDLRVHACTLCLETLGSINGHSILNCPWILEKN